jgi:hypothetical protein
VIVWLDPPRGAHYTLLADARRVAIAHPGEHDLRVRAGGHAVTIGERVDVCRELVAALEDLDFTVGIEA